MLFEFEASFTRKKKPVTIQGRVEVSVTEAIALIREDHAIRKSFIKAMNKSK